jgi:hypothetical protein
MKTTRLVLFLLLVVALPAAASTPVETPAKLTVTLVRWPYT